MLQTLSNLFTSSDWLSLAGIFLDLFSLIVTSGLIAWVVWRLQKKHDNEQQFKEHMANEVATLGNEYKEFIEDLSVHGMQPREYRSKIHRLNSKSAGIMSILKNDFELDEHSLMPYAVELDNIVTESNAFISAYNGNNHFTLSNNCLEDIRALQANNDHIFNDLIRKIYKYES